MSRLQKLLRQLVGVVSAVLLLVGCSTPAATPRVIPTSAQLSRIPPTVTPISPTATSVPLVVYVSTPEPGIKFYIFPEREQPGSESESRKYVFEMMGKVDSGQPMRNTFPSGTRKIYIVFSKAGGPDVRRLDMKIYTSASPAPLQVATALAFTVYEAAGGVTTLFPISPESGMFADGSYQAKVEVNDTLFAMLNWTIGGSGAR